MKSKPETRDVLLFCILIMLVVNFLYNTCAKKVEAETFRLDSCITTTPSDKPTAYLHVVTH